jgi:hypothetical protein
MVLVESTCPGTMPFQAPVPGTPIMSAEDLEKLRQEMVKVKPMPAPSSNTVSYRFSKIGPMEYEALNKDSLAVLMSMLDMLQLGYTVNTEYGIAGNLSRWVITIYDPDTMREIAK